jgi:hypothetical protein
MQVKYNKGTNKQTHTHTHTYLITKKETQNLIPKHINCLIMSKV